MTPSSIDPQELARRRSECIDAWEDNAPVAAKRIVLQGGPLDQYSVLWGDGAEDWTGTYYNDAGDMVLYRYEMGEDGPEYSGVQLITDIADAATGAHEPGPLDEETRPENLPTLDLETMTAEEATDVLIEDNDRRVTQMREATNGQVDLTNAFDILFLKVYLTHLVEEGSPSIAGEARLDFEDQKSRMLDEIIANFEKMQAEREKMMAQQRLAVQQAPPMAPVHQGRVTLPGSGVRRG
jgi:hypothetical protein